MTNSSYSISNLLPSYKVSLYTILHICPFLSPSISLMFILADNSSFSQSTSRVIFLKTKLILWFPFLQKMFLHPQHFACTSIRAINIQSCSVPSCVHSYPLHETEFPRAELILFNLVHNKCGHELMGKPHITEITQNKEATGWRSYSLSEIRYMYFILGWRQVLTKVILVM